jgi:hypothetical protein
LQVEKIYILVTQNNSTTTSDIYMTWQVHWRSVLWLPAEYSSSSTNNRRALLLATGVGL